ncbi:hypothetical protein BJX63DRAFT_417653 [Aspergillus granulosus]|uniref:Fungal-specific transcription factor n=1 Tax=Aspergillus granulosus TaxID=176169 RepID=A0ABR4I5Q0_9EURO
MHRIASIPGDGIGPEVVSGTIQVVNKLASKLGFQIEFTHIPWGTNYYKQNGQFMSDDALDVLRTFDACLFGAVGDPSVPDHISLWGLLLKIRGPLQLYANVRPVRTFPGTKSPLNTAKNGIDWVLVRENSEGEYCGQGGRSHVGHPWEAATEVAIFTRFGIERIMRFAFETAQSRPRKKLTVVTKSNAMRHGMVLWDEVAEEVSRDFPDVDWDKMLVDAITIRMVAQPDSLDTIVGTNLHMDILSDLAAGLAGSIGVAPSSNLDPTRKNPSVFEPVHGSAFDITGKGVANPVATFWSAAEMLTWLGEKDAADKLMGCVERVCAAGILTADLGGKAKTQDVVDAIGSLTAQSPQESQFVGSSSGVFFINTVRQAFFSSSGEFPPPEDTLVGSLWAPHSSTHEETPVSQWEYDPSIACVLGQAPPQQLARDLMMVYFKVWHPLFPFLHGPTFLHAMESLYAEKDATEVREPSQNKHNTSWTTIFQCIFHLASLVRADLQLPAECRIQTPISISMHSLLSPLTARHDLLSLQALLASQLYLVATMSLRTASTVGGCMLRSMLHAGLHRCPFRYRELSASSQHRHLRKRIFWSAYALDRYLSQALGLPLGVQDSDIDVCPPGSPEIHKPLLHLPPPDTPTPQPSESEFERGKKETPFASYVQSGKLTGEALELFHKSIFVRSISQTSVLVLTTSVHKWWNSLDLPPSPLPQRSSSSSHQSPTSIATIDSTPFNYTPFFTILYQHLLLLLHRPSLSLPNSTPEFASALQSCISAARHILLALKAQRDSHQALFWPGFLSAAWMAGLVLAFACQLGQYGRVKGCQEISSCLEFLRIMSTQWEPAKHCHRALSLLLRAVSRLDTIAGPATAPPSGPISGTITTGHSTDIGTGTGNTIPAMGSRTDPDPKNINPASISLDESHLSPSTSRKKRRFDASFTSSYQHPSGPSGSSFGPGADALGQIRPGESLDEGGDRLDIAEGASGSSSQQDLHWDQSLGLDMNMVDLLQEGNFDSLMDLFGQQYPTF